MLIDCKVTAHSSKSKHMNFLEKNFEYSRVQFGLFLEGIERGETAYLRAISTDRPAGKPTELAEDFPSISSDFRLPEELRFVSENAHSSPLRISGPVEMWLHYDVSSFVLVY